MWRSNDPIRAVDSTGVVDFESKVRTDDEKLKVVSKAIARVDSQLFVETVPAKSPRFNSGFLRTGKSSSVGFIEEPHISRVEEYSSFDGALNGKTVLEALNQFYRCSVKISSCMMIGFFNTGAYQESLSGYGGTKHCLLPAPKHVVVDRDDEGQVTSKLFADEQSAATMLNTLGYE